MNRSKILSIFSVHIGVIHGIGNVGNTLTYIIGLTSGILGLVALLSVFVSINIQQSIEKAREILNELKIYPYNYSHELKEDIGPRIFQKYFLYSDITTKRANKFALELLRLLRGSIGIVVILWMVGLFIQIPTTGLSEILLLVLVTSLAFILMGWFWRILGKMNDIAGIANLPRVGDLLDVRKVRETHVNTLYLIAVSAQIELFIDSGRIYVAFATHLPFHHYFIHLFVSLPIEDEVGCYPDLVYEQELIVTEKDFSSMNPANMLMHRIPISELDLNYYDKPIVFTVHLSSDSGEIAVNYENYNLSLEERTYTHYLIPLECHERANKVTSEFTPWERWRHFGLKDKLKGHLLTILKADETIVVWWVNGLKIKGSIKDFFFLNDESQWVCRLSVHEVIANPSGQEDILYFVNIRENDPVVAIYSEKGKKLWRKRSVFRMGSLLRY